MYFIFCLFIFVLSMIIPKIEPKTELKLIFSDEFNGNEIDENKWDVYSHPKKCITYL